jgi:hypothetical protein
MNLFKAKEQHYWLAYLSTRDNNQQQSISIVGYKPCRLAPYDKAGNLIRNAYEELQDVWGWLVKNKDIRAHGLLLCKKNDDIYTIVESFQLAEQNGKTVLGRIENKGIPSVGIKGELDSGLLIPP